MSRCIHDGCPWDALPESSYCEGHQPRIGIESGHHTHGSGSDDDYLMGWLDDESHDEDIIGILSSADDEHGDDKIELVGWADDESNTGDGIDHDVGLGSDGDSLGRF